MPQTSPSPRSRHPSCSSRQGNGPSPSYSFPGGRVTSGRERQSSSSRTMRDTSPRHQHEIQPPSRRLSSHQMLLLTPFGSMIPEDGETSAAGSSGMSRGMTRGDGGMVGPAVSTPRRPNNRLRSLPTALQSRPLGSAPMTTIPSADSELSESESRDVVSSMYPTFIGDHLSTIPMTRSTSSPVMSMKSLEALKMKDGELGIARGGIWAWVSHEGDATDPSSVTGPSVPFRPHVPPPLSNDETAQPMFRDPFAASTPISASFMSRETPTESSSTSGPSHQATAAGYHYSADEPDGRRMSEAVNTGVSATAAKALMALRRPSVPLNILLQSARRSSLLSLPPTSVLETPQESNEDDLGVPTAKSSPAQPHRRLSRYRSLPDRRLNLAFTMQDPSESSALDEEKQRGSVGHEPEISPKNQPRRKLSTTGAWAAVEVVDSLAAPSSPIITRRSSLSPTSADPELPGGTDQPLPNPQYRFGNLVPPAPHRRRWDSVDSAFPTSHEPTGLQVSIGPLSETDWSASFPRRGSLIVLTKTPLAPWASVERSGINVEMGQAAWTERRGSWVDDWDLRGK